MLFVAVVVGEPGATITTAIRPGAAPDLAQVQATYQDGVLRLVLPKSPEARPRRIAVQVTGATAP